MRGPDATAHASLRTRPTPLRGVPVARNVRPARRSSIALLLTLGILAGPGVARAQDEVVEAAAAPPRKVGVNIDLEASSVYVFRGLNVFKNTSQWDQTGMIAPSLTYTVPGVGIHVGYWGAFQLAGSNRGALVASGYGNEQNLIVGVTRGLGKGFTLDASLTWYFFPFATRAAAGTTLPSSLEPSLTLAWAGPVDLELKVLYFASIQEVLKDYRYLYVRPRISKTFPINPTLGINLGLGFGYKLFNDFRKMKDNVYDVRADVGLPLQFGDLFYLTPGVHLAWTNLEGVRTRNEFVAYGGLNVGVNL